MSDLDFPEEVTEEARMEAHELAKYFPMLEGDEFDMLVEDIREHGQLEPIVTVDGKILDGVNRYRACEKIGIEAETEEYDGDDPLSYVISLNIRRRHMDVSQRAMLAQEMLPEFERQARERKSESAKEQHDGVRFGRTGSKDPQQTWHDEHRARDDAAKMFGVSSPTIQRAKRIKEKAPQSVVDDIIRGKTTVTAVDADLRAAEADRIAATRKGKQNLREVKEHPKYVKEWLDAARTFREVTVLAIKGAKHIALAPEAAQMIGTKFAEIGKLVEELKELT